MDYEDLLEQFSAYTSVDKHALDDEFEHHPQQLWRVAESLAEAHRFRSAAKVMLERAEAQARSDELRAWGEKKQRLTDKVLASIATLDTNVRRRQAALLELEEVCEKLQGLLSAMQAKTSALKHLSELCQAGYYVSNSGKRMRRTGET